MMPGIGISLMFILTLVLAIISTAQAVNHFPRQPEAAPDPVKQTFFIPSDVAHGREVWRADGASGLLAHGDRLFFAGDEGGHMATEILASAVGELERRS
jgi:Na+-transporting methylmalonyl-CoA/oxaloacetate decarboxylase gamma subunit